MEKDDGCQEQDETGKVGNPWKEMDRRESRVGVFRLPPHSLASTSAGGGHRKNGCGSESSAGWEQLTPSAGGGRAKPLRSEPLFIHLSSFACQACPPFLRLASAVPLLRPSTPLIHLCSLPALASPPAALVLGRLQSSF